MKKFNDLVVRPLGTVSTYCCGDLCCPGYLIKYGSNNILLDCGNGITRHLNIPDDLKNLTVIISHLHSDHYGDLLSLAQTSLVLHRLGYLSERINVYIPNSDKIKASESYIDSDGWGSSRIVEKNLPDYDYLLCLEQESFLRFIPYQQNNILEFDDLITSFVKNPHPITTYSTKLETDGLKVVYSSDTGYNGNKLEKFAEDANLLICESTFLRGQTRMTDHHLFAHEAGKIAASANVKQLMLTHFWPSIDKSEYVKEAMEEFNNVVAAEEGKQLVLRRNNNG